jgi:hypothetical protein
MSPTSKRRVGYVLTGIAILFLLFDSVGKLVPVPQAVEGSVALGWPENSVRVIGIILLVCVILYSAPQTALLGAVLLTGYLGGAVATQLRVGNPLFSHILFPIYVALLIWGGLLLRNERLRALFPIRRDSSRSLP